MHRDAAPELPPSEPEAWYRRFVDTRSADAARFLAAHTPTRRELPQVVNIATRLRRGEALVEDA